MRVFTAINFKPAAKHYLHGLAGKIASSYRDARLTRLENLHMTIVFIGEADRIKTGHVIKALRETAKEIERFNIAVNGISSFRKKNKHTVICTIRNSLEMEKLHASTVRNLRKEGLEIEEVVFRPHITLARQAELIANENTIKIPEQTLEVDEICVMESSRINGVLTYTPLAKFRLGVSE
ncbi:MAG TPA: RNA 2',3'-cyclic phosphodiesterase [Clostridia bacterium]|nr:RNA 2',3'-cyclic phosphodiesterase [Clostridia bacterium]HRX41286.1 RNA 2',3'-cyclic phosphodiesterase [Clostridia bacterium]